MLSSVKVSSSSSVSWSIGPVVVSAGIIGTKEVVVASWTVFDNGVLVVAKNLAVVVIVVDATTIDTLAVVLTTVFVVVVVPRTLISSKVLVVIVVSSWVTGKIGDLTVELVATISGC